MSHFVSILPRDPCYSFLMKWIALLVGVVAPLGQVLAKEKVDLYLMIGQSNMAGRAPLMAGDQGIMEGCLLLNDKRALEPAKNPLNRYSTIRKSINMQKMGPSYQFALEMKKNSKASWVGLVDNAKGGSSIKEWRKSGKFFKDAVARVNAALSSKDYDVELKGICWHQGESDSKDAHYVRKLEVLIGDFRSVFNRPTLPFVVGEINAKGDKQVEAFNNRLAAIKQKLKGVDVVSAKGLVSYDRWHFDNKSSKNLGMRYARSIQAIEK